MMSISPTTTLLGLSVLVAISLTKSGRRSLGSLRLRIQDLAYVVLGLVLPHRPAGKVIPAGLPGHGGMWPQYNAPGSDDSRSPCPGLNAMANHGILPHNGRQITRDMFMKAISQTYNFAPTLAEVVTHTADFADQGRGSIDLADLYAQGAVQHDASFTRADIAVQVDQATPHAEIIDRLLSRASDGKQISLSDLGYELSIRRYECSKTNGQYYIESKHKTIGALNAAFLSTVFGGKVEDLAVWLKEERLRDGWEPHCRQPYGLPKLFQDLASFKIEYNAEVNPKLRAGDAFITQQVAPGKGSSYTDPDGIPSEKA